MAGLKFKKGPAQAAAAAPAQGKPTLNVAKLDIPRMLGKQLNIPPEAVQQLMQLLAQTKSPAQAAMLIKQFDHNPATMHEPFNPQQAMQKSAQLGQGTPPQTAPLAASQMTQQPPKQPPVAVGLRMK